MAASTGTALNVNKLDWWARHEAQLPFLNSGSNAVILFQLSSAASEWAFSFLSNIFRDTQHSSLEDYICTSIILTTCVCRLVSIITIIIDKREYLREFENNCNFGKK